MIRYGFLDPILVEPLDKEIFRIREAVRYRSSGNGKWPFVLGREIVIPKGFTCDGSSFPWVTWSLLPGKMEVIGPGALHDLCYRVGPSIGVFRPAADWLMWEAMDLGGDGEPWQRNVIWGIVRGFGWRTWRQWRKLDLKIENPMFLTTYLSDGTVWQT